MGYLNLDTTQEQQSGPEAVSKSGDEITMHCTDPYGAH